MLLSLFLALQAAAPAPATASIYFDSGEGTLIRPEWTASLTEVATRLPSGTRLRLDAFTDRAGPAAANRIIARQRADAVRAALVRHGVPPASIAIVAHGEADPLVATPDGVREPQNRRVDLTLVP